MKKIGIAAILIAFGCSTLNRSAMDPIRNKMTQREVRDLLGQPERVVPSEFDPRETTWMYARDGELCQVTFRLGFVYGRPACQSAERRKELEELALDREPDARARIKAEEHERKIKEAEASRFTRTLRDPN